MASGSAVNMTMDELITSFSANPSDSKRQRYFGVQMEGITENSPIVLQKLPNPKIFLALCPTVRFKEFDSRQEALSFSKLEVPPVIDENFRRTVEPRSPFPNPPQSEKDLLVAAISAGNGGVVRRLAWKNPKLLVTADDSPQCYRGTWRQTVLHLAVQAQNFPLFCTVMEVIENPAFAALTQLTQFENLPERQTVIVRNFLNNRTKKEESVLDCAVIFGMVEIVDFLTVHPLCDLKTTGKLQHSLKSVVCSRSNPDRKVHSSTILDMMEGRWYLPLYSASELFEKSVIAEPILVESMRDALRDGKLAGFFGPLSCADCARLFTDWKESQKEGLRSRSRSRAVTPASETDPSEADDDMESRKSEEDGERCVGMGMGKGSAMRKSPKSRLTGLKRTEEACRLLARKNSMPWKEWWSFLGAFLDISSERGLVELEGYLADSLDKKTSDATVDPWPSAPCIMDNLTVVEILSASYTRSAFANIPTNTAPTAQGVTMEYDDCEDDDTEDVFYTPPSSPEPIDKALEQFSLRYARRQSLYIGGRKPNFSDYAVFDALKDVKIADNFRYILAWKALMEKDLQKADLTDTMSRLFL